MKNDLKRIFSLALLIFISVFTFNLTSHASEASVIKFNGFESERFDGGFIFEKFELSRKDLFTEFKNLMPGDVKQQEIVFKNACHTHEGLHLYLRYKGKEDSKNLLPLLDMEIRRDSPTGAVVFTGKADNAFSDIDLGKIAEGPAGKSRDTSFFVKLSVPASLGNEYMDAMAELDWAFVVTGYGKRTVTVIVKWEAGIPYEDYKNYNLPAQLYCDDFPVGSAVWLNEGNNWYHVFRNLDSGHRYEVVVGNIPAGYSVQYTKDGTVILVEADDGGAVPPTPGPGGGGGSGGGSSGSRSLTVEKVWVDDGTKRPERAVVELYENRRLKETVILNEENVWMHTFMFLKPDREYYVKERNVPINYDDTYEVKNNRVIITNTRNDRTGKDSFKVIKRWDSGAKKLPPFVYVTLYKGMDPVETVKLSKENSWQHVFEGLDPYGVYSCYETAIPAGFAPTYKIDGENLIITNLITLPQTGNNNLLPVILALLGAAFIFLGLLLKKKRKKDER